MRRRFNQSLLPKEPPPPEKKTRQPLEVRTAFNKWFKEMLSKNNITLKEFCVIAGCNYNTASQWQRKHNPQLHGQMDIAWGMEQIGQGEYKSNLQMIKRLCKR